MKCISFDVIDSTNTYLKNNYQQLDDLCFVSSNSQTNGHGRNNRVWHSDGSNLLFSLLIKDEFFFDKYKSLSIIMAYSIVQTLENIGVHGISIKWPNDVYVDNKKICGILLESVSKEKLECLIVGIGINVNQIEFTGEYLVEPTSIKQVLNKNVNTEEFKKIVYETILTNLKLLKDGHDFYKQIYELDYLKGKQVYALINNEPKLVEVLGINDDYSLCVKNEDDIVDIETGEISFHV